MKLRFRNNSLRLRVNQREVEGLASGALLEEQVLFPGDGRISYTLQSSSAAAPEASFRHGVISVLAPQQQVDEWASSGSIGMYFDFPANGTSLKVAIEKDLECIDGPPEEQDANAFPRGESKNC